MGENILDKYGMFHTLSPVYSPYNHLVDFMKTKFCYTPSGKYQN